MCIEVIRESINKWRTKKDIVQDRPVKWFSFPEQAVLEKPSFIMFGG